MFSIFKRKQNPIIGVLVQKVSLLENTQSKLKETAIEAGAVTLRHSQTIAALEAQLHQQREHLRKTELLASGFIECGKCDKRIPSNTANGTLCFACARGN